MPRALLRLALLLVCVGLAASRLGLLAHELLGHGGATLALGGRVTEVRLFWFAGGWIRYELVEATLAGYMIVALGGVAVELIAGTILWIRVTGDSLGARLVRGIAAMLWVHAGWYLATGAWHGYGDGELLYRELGDARFPFAIVVGSAACLAAFAGARWLTGAIAATIPGSRAARIGGTLAAVVLAGTIHAGLTLGELHVRRDALYRAMMAPERERLVARDLAVWRAAQPRASDAEREAEVHALEAAHRTFPFAVLLAFALALAVVAGAVRSRARPHSEIAPRLLLRLAILAVWSVGVVIAIGALTR